MKKLILPFICILGLSVFASAQTLTRSQMENLKSVMWKSIHNLHSPDGTSEFSGSYDWHSDVHAHWALLSMARVTKDAALDKKMTSILTLERIEKEFQFLRAPENANFEKPYGRSWFLLLLWELNHRPISKNIRFQQIRWLLSQDILQWLTTTAFPEDTYNKRLIGTHDSWLMSLFLFDLAKSQNPRTAQRLDDLIQTRMVPLAHEIENHPMEYNDFLFLPALKYLINPDHHYDRDHLPIPTDTNYACHYPGAIQVSLWAYSSQCAKDDQRSCDDVRNASQEFVRQTRLWKDDFDCVAHWVPQFTWMTHWLSLGKP